jgi:predicted PurR-regulated permease PerM
LFEGFAAEFIPIVGTYVAGAVPALVALLYDPVDALIVVIWILLYQQIENYLLSPRLTAKTMDLSAPVALAAALIGGMLGGILFAFLALPVAGVIQAAARAYGRYYDVVQDGAAGGPAAPPGSASQTSRPGRGRWIGRKGSGSSAPKDGGPPSN